jgi:pimeloyl-ACP methyl ester carboxylesterase
MLGWQGCFQFRIADAKVLEKFREKSQPLQIADYAYDGNKKIHYFLSGNADAPTLFLIHGTPGAWNAFEQYLLDPELTKHFRVISVDRPGFGFSNFGKAETLEKQAEVFAALLRSIDNGKPALLAGHSLGGPIAVHMAASHPGLCSHLILLAASISPRHEPAENWRKPLANSMLRWLLPGAFRPSNDELIWFKESVRTMPELMHRVRCTVYVVHGTRDVLVPYENALFAEKNFPNASQLFMCTLEGSNHFFVWQKFEEVKNLLLKMNGENTHLSWK